MPDVTIYTRTTCAPCRTVKAYLKMKNVPYRELNVDDDPELLREVMDKSGMMMVPVTQVGQTIVSGANLGLLAKLLMV